MRKLFNIYMARLELKLRGEYYQGIDHIVIRHLRFIANQKEQEVKPKPVIKGW